ncbi:MAG: cell division protein FtsA [Candidatus Paralactobacillus gallistercoris]|uniref:Cell division protein FtsA n=1 Tax=Candidatus Paralactobacillus gallistercoris TaxID=2838724 RepID=A0A948TKA8_9LACO|nr:cell division protein FtsA [Candidatus Paralactobacillus gallistercoris]
MGKSDIYVGLDVGTTSIKVIVAEYVKGQMNVIGVGSERSEGLSRGVIVDIDKTVAAIQSAVHQAEQKANIQIEEVVTGIPATMLQIEPVQGMVKVGDQAKEISSDDVREVAAAALVRNLPPEREIINLIPDEFIVDGFDGIKDPRGMIGVRLELHGILFTAPKTIIHNTEKCIEKAGLKIKTFAINPLALAQLALSDGERDFGTVLIDLGGGQSTASVIHDNKLKFTSVDQEGGEYITKDISVVLNTTFANAEKIKRDYGVAMADEASETETFPVKIVGQDQPKMISEKYLAEIIEARLTQIFERLNHSLQMANALDLPGGIIMTGGVTALPGITDLASRIFKRPVKLYIPNQMGLRHPSFSQALSLIKYATQLTEVDMVVASALPVNADHVLDNLMQVSENDAEVDAEENYEMTPAKPKKKKKKNEKINLRHWFDSFFD